MKRSLWDCFDDIPGAVRDLDVPEPRDREEFLYYGLSMLCAAHRCEHVSPTGEGWAIGMLPWRAFVCTECASALQDSGGSTALVPHDCCDLCLERTTLFFPLVLGYARSTFTAEACGRCHEFLRTFVPRSFGAGQLDYTPGLN